MTRPNRGNCYYASEALYHILGGKRAGWVPNVMRLPNGETHWFLRHRETHMILDPSRLQFLKDPLYENSRNTGFLTKRPSKGARKVMEVLTWQER